ncbi:helix-turn-helix domain-containing protein [Lichenihabitans psoromatis]|uniref:helix-turn-helix domain-containing protein n=1 Tax=Lichenihabitans psoromatis TaxID=2528642 RepID=UPI001038491E|nr:helix-turn-helix transcriptional regulator [Lichenihabitans psoromatis]
MRQSGGQKTYKSAEISAQLVGHRLCVFLRRLHPHKTIDRVAADTGISRATVAKWIEREGSPSVPALIKLGLAYGPDLMLAVAPELAWLVTIAKLTQHQALEAQIDQVETDLSAVFDQLRGRR